MLNDIFDGEAVSLIEMLDSREQRYYMEQKLLTEFQGSSLLVLTMNIAGEIKNSREIKRVFESALQSIEEGLKGESLDFKQITSDKTGNTAYLVLPVNPKDLKEKMIQIERKHPQGRLLDLDVLYKEDEELIKVSRSDINMEPRTCFVCQKDAKECARSRAHTNDEIKEAIASIIRKK